MDVRGSRRGLRRVSLLLLIAQLVAQVVAPIAEARAGTVPEPDSHVEQAHTEQCVVLHRPDACIACQLTAIRALLPHSDLASLIAAGLVIAVALPCNARFTPHTAFSSSLNSRAPPASAA